MDAEKRFAEPRIVTNRPRFVDTALTHGFILVSWSLPDVTLMATRRSSLIAAMRQELNLL